MTCFKNSAFALRDEVKSRNTLVRIALTLLRFDRVQVYSVHGTPPCKFWLHINSDSLFGGGGNV
jgi:hypothetical protein